MTIFEQILAGLQQKFSGVDTATLTRIATKKAEGVMDETKVNSIVEGISFQDVMQNYGDFRAGQAQTSAVSNYERKHGLKDGKPVKEPEEKKEEKKDEKKDEVPSWAQALIDSNKTLSEKLSAYESEKAQAQRNSQISAVAKKYGIPEFMLKDRNIPENTDLDTYFKDMKQDMSNSGFQFAKAPETAEQKQDKEASEFAKMIEADTKQIVEQQNK
ncbi:hypothetical protein [Phocaeicola plebeius]|uniref:hypothetical protein n=1 Tax=Phocaeicola plebeius TaxID=310297 RepID=UPI002924B3DB|nr:hypothetical protein AUSP0032_00019 [uncultured phage]